MAVRSKDLTLVATVQAEASDLASASTSLLERHIATATDAILSYIGRPLHRETLTETHGSTGGLFLVLERRPVVSVTSVSFNGTAYETTDYELEDAAAGILYKPTRWPYTGRMLPGLLQEDKLAGSEQKLISVVYVGGYVTPAQVTEELARTLPYDLEQACIDTVISLYRRRGRALDIASESIGVASVTYRNPNSVIGVGQGGVLPDSVIPTLDFYRSLR